MEKILSKPCVMSFDEWLNMHHPKGRYTMNLKKLEEEYIDSMDKELKLYRKWMKEVTNDGKDSR